MLDLQGDQIIQNRRLSDLETDTDQLEDQIINLEAHINNFEVDIDVIYLIMEGLEDSVENNTAVIQDLYNISQVSE